MVESKVARDRAPFWIQLDQPLNVADVVLLDYGDSERGMTESDVRHDVLRVGKQGWVQLRRWME